MDSEIKNQTAPEPKQNNSVEDDKYAKSLINMVNVQYEAEQKSDPQKRIKSVKKMVYLVMILITIVSSALWIKSFFSDHDSDAKDQQQLLDSVNYTKDLER